MSGKDIKRFERLPWTPAKYRPRNPNQSEYYNLMLPWLVEQWLELETNPVEGRTPDQQILSLDKVRDREQEVRHLADEINPRAALRGR